IMENRQSLSQITKNSLLGIERILEKEKPNMVLVQGDTTTAFAGALAAFYQKIKIAHIEAGLRTNNKYYPFPEEINRHLISVLADFHFAPTEKSCQNLLTEGVKRDNIFISGNTVIDSLFLMSKENYIFNEPLLREKKIVEKKFILVTMHRRENWGKPLRETCQAILKLIEEYSDLMVIFPIHKNPEIRKNVNKILKNRRRVLLLDTLDYKDMVNLMCKSYIILTDSGGIQEEAPSLGKPVLVLRNETERPEAVEAGVVKLIGTNSKKIIEEVKELLDNKDRYRKMIRHINPYGDGKASERIVKRILYYFNLIDQSPDEFKVK
ncbi:MAG TPA: UDP-N-acetylglucosamine 2-epimerase (non-hydrolyzing), partial [Candidatus Atribacteria bacterium]|nr:UDP-N-acetylglucosamine 2-epimerase (non-hydrolyzing) [Candidatus Atribacteria bacterium]